MYFLLVPLQTVDITPISEQLVRSLHRHAAEIRNQVSTISMTSDTTFRAPASILSAKREYISTVTAPVCTDIGEGFEAMGYPVVDLLFVVLSSIRLGYTFSDDLFIAFLVASVSAVFTLITGRV